MKKNNIIILLLIATFIALIYIKPQTELFAVVGRPDITYSIDFDDITEKMMFGSDIFDIQPTIYNTEVCAINEYNAPKPNPNCWTGIVYFQDQTLPFHYGETLEINDFFTATFTTSAEFENPDDEHDNYWINPKESFFTFEMYNDDFLEAKILHQDTLLTLNEDKNLLIEVRNDLANDLEGGLIITTTNYLKNQVPILETKKLTFEKGINQYEIPLNTSFLGRMNIKIRPFADIMGIEFYDDRIDELTFNLVPFIDEGAFNVDCAESPCGKGFRCEHIVYENKEYNICMKTIEGEDIINEWSIEKVDTRLLIGLFIVFAVLIYSAHREAI